MENSPLLRLKVKNVNYSPARPRRFRQITQRSIPLDPLEQNSKIHNGGQQMITQVNKI